MARAAPSRSPRRGGGDEPRTRWALAQAECQVWAPLSRALALVLSLPAMYARQAGAAGWLGLVGHGLLMAGMVLFLLYAGGSLVDPRFSMHVSVAVWSLGLSAIIGLLITAIATVRAGVYPRWSG